MRSGGDSSTVLAVAQFAPTADPAANLDSISELAHAAARQGARIAVFPEYSSYFVDPFDESLARHAQGLDGPFVSALTELAASTGMHIVAGMIESGSDTDASDAELGRSRVTRVRNTVVVVNITGIVAHYRKLHLYDAFGQRESDWVQAGDLGTPATFVVDGIRFAPMTCYDLRFPEVARTLVDAGAEVILIPAEWVRGALKLDHWRTLLHARAIENTVYVAAADHPPPLGVGYSAVVDPEGVAIATVGTSTDIALGAISRAVIDRVRVINPALQLRRYSVAPRE